MRTNARNNVIHDGVEGLLALAAAIGVRPDHDPYDGCRYVFDEVLTPSNGWTQYDTTQDASYFGVWVNVERRLTFTYAEGDMYFVECPTLDSFRAEIADMQRCYGDAPPFAIGIDADGTRTAFYDESARPKV